MISVRGLAHRYASTEVLRVPEWSVAQGERWLVLGPSGCGKTTLLHALAGLIRPSEGEVRVAETDLRKLDGGDLDRWRGATVGIVLQGLHLVRHLSVRDNLRLAQYMAHAPQDDARVADALGALGVADKAARRPADLSEGERQRVAIGIYHADAPTGNIPLAAVQAFQKNRLVRKVIPLALGDGWKGFRIVGAGHEYLEHYGAKPAIGRLWDKPMEVVLGAEVAARTGVGVGARFAGAHGITGQGEEHGAAPYKVVGLLGRTGSVLDRLVLTSVESVWQVHEQEHGPEDKADRKALEEDREVTVLLLQYASPLAAAMLPRQINSQSELQAASPAYETARLFRIVGVGVEAMRAFAIVLIIAAGLSVFIALYTALEERRYDLAVMRTLGAAPGRLFGLLIMEGVVLAALGTLIGLALGHALAATLALLAGRDCNSAVPAPSLLLRSGIPAWNNSTAPLFSPCAAARASRWAATAR